jgi:hypothetical protein
MTKSELHLLKLFQEQREGGIKENDGEGEFNYEILQELL